MSMCRALSVLVRGTMKSLKAGVHQGSVLSPLLFIILLKPCQVSSALGFPGRISMLMTLLS